MLVVDPSMCAVSFPAGGVFTVPVGDFCRAVSPMPLYGSWVEAFDVLVSDRAERLVLADLIDQASSGGFVVPVLVGRGDTAPLELHNGFHRTCVSAMLHLPVTFRVVDDDHPDPDDGDGDDAAIEVSFTVERTEAWTPPSDPDPDAWMWEVMCAVRSLPLSGPGRWADADGVSCCGDDRRFTVVPYVSMDDADDVVAALRVRLGRLGLAVTSVSVAPEEL